MRTSDKENAGTQGQVSVIVCGAKGCTGELTLGPPSSKTFEPGSNEEFEVSNLCFLRLLKILFQISKHERGMCAEVENESLKILLPLFFQMDFSGGVLVNLP